jgi:hypothetical protein
MMQGEAGKRRRSRSTLKKKRRSREDIAKILIILYKVYDGISIHKRMFVVNDILSLMFEFKDEFFLTGGHRYLSFFRK